ncbi:NAD(P)/FAD-dependent oxidoreductase [Brucella anthropi]|uniref:NAD(P)/FAD-dependent oxidoreductase n=1 Tax=Brucella anthropi TaxID=529 RepID=UPI001F18AFC1|nr:FAD-dependent oxidoreductase [Brucella anthropi]
MPAIRILPADGNTNGWSRMLPVRTPNAALKGDIKADWIVLGAGYAGLAAARRLAENRPNDQIALIDAQEVGKGTSGRAAGFAIDLPHNVSSSMEELAKSHSYRALARAAIDHLKQQIDQHGINCDWRQDGKFHAAVSDQGMREVLEPTVKELERLKEPFDWLEGDAPTKRLGTSHFKAAIFTYGISLLNPTALVRGLADSVRALPGSYGAHAVKCDRKRSNRML